MAVRSLLALSCASLLLPAISSADSGIQVPAEVIVSSDTSYVKGSNRADRLLAKNSNAGITVVGADGIPVVYGVRVRETEEERNEPVWRNARVIDNKLFTNDDMPPNSVLEAFPSPASLSPEYSSSPPSSPPSSPSSMPPAASSSSFSIPSSPPTSSLPTTERDLETTTSESGVHRQGRILTYGGGKPFGFHLSTTTLPPFYYQSYYNPGQQKTQQEARPSRYPSAQKPVRSQQSVHNQAFKVMQGPDMTGTRGIQSNYEYSTEYQTGFEPTTQYDADETTTAPVYVAYSDSRFNMPAKQILKRPGNQLQYAYTPGNKLKYSYSPDSDDNGYLQTKGGQSPGANPSSSAQPPTAYPDPTRTAPTLKRPTPKRVQTVRRPTIKQPSQFEKRFQSVQSPSSSSSGRFRFPSASTGSSTSDSQAGTILSPGSYKLPSAASEFQNSVDPFSGRPVSPDQFKIKQMAFQSVPGGPIVNIPVPIPNSQKTKTRKPNRRFSLLGGLFRGGSRRPAQNRFSQQTSSGSSSSAYQQQFASAPSGLGYDQYNYYNDNYQKPTLYTTLTNPIRKLGEGVIEFTKPVTQPFREATDRLSEELGLTAPYSTDLLDDKTGAVDPEEALIVGGLVAGAGALAGLGILVYANTVTNQTHYIIGRRKRSLGEEREDLDVLNNLVGDLEAEEASFVDVLRQEGFQKWSQGPCARRLFCKFMVEQDSHVLTRISGKVSTFLSYLDKGEPDGLMAQARQLQKAIERRQCDIYRCGKQSADSSQDDNTVESSQPNSVEQKPTEPRPR